MAKANQSLFDINNFVPSLRDAIQAAGLDLANFQVALPTNDTGERMEVRDRHRIFLSDGKKVAEWSVRSLRELFRGDKVPPSMMKYPEEYTPVWYFIESHVLAASEKVGDLTDKEFEEIYAMLRRRPDGKSLGPMHDYLWQAAATVLGARPLSQAEYEEVIGRLARSCGTWQLGLASRNYLAYLRRTLG